MPLHIPDHNAPRLKIELLGGIFSSIAYGIVIVLSGNCFHLLQRKQGIYSNRMRIILLIYVTFMLLISTWAVMGPIFIFMNIFSIINNLLFYHSTQLPITVTMWGADGFLVRILILRQEQIFTMQWQVWRCLVLYHDVSRGPRIAIIVLLSLISLASFGKPIYISTPSFNLLINILSMRCCSIGRRNENGAQASVPYASVHFTLRSRKYHTRSPDSFPTRLPSKILPKCPWSGTWISLYQHHYHVRRIFSIDGHCRWPVHHSVFRVVEWANFHVRYRPSYLRRWLETQ